MTRMLRPCLDCGLLARHTRCLDCQRRRDRERDQRRGTTSERGYGTAHQRRRAELAPLVATGTVQCARCPHLIAPDEPWDLDHPDDGGPQQPAHAACNRAAGARRAAAFLDRPPTP